MKKKYIVISIIVAICIIISLLYRLNDKKINNKLSNYNIIKESISNDKNWNEKNAIEQFTELEYNNRIYLSTDLKIDLENIDKEKDVTNIIASEDSESMHKKQITIYSIKDISIKYAVAVQFDNDENYYLYINSEEVYDLNNDSTINKYDKETNTTSTIESTQNSKNSVSKDSESIK